MFETPPEGMRRRQVAREENYARGHIHIHNLGACQATEGLIYSAGDH